jgi:ferredoxin
MLRKIIAIDEEKCVGCAECAQACHENAIVMVNGKAKLAREDYCDGMGDCLPSCPVNAISFTEREAAPYQESPKEKPAALAASPRPIHKREEHERSGQRERNARLPAPPLRQWPIQIHLVPIKAQYFDEAELVIAADCTAYAYAQFHENFIQGQTVIIGCPKLDKADYTEKLTNILQANAIKSVHIVRMEVPCCGGLARAVSNALQKSGKTIPCSLSIISIDGQIQANE